MTRRSGSRPSAAGAVRAITAVDFRRLFHDRIALFSILVLPVLIIIVIGTTIGTGPRHMPIGVLDQDGGDVARELTARLSSTGVADLTTYTDLETLQRDIRTQAQTAGLVLPPGLSAAAASGRPAAFKLLVPQSQGGGQAAQTVIQSAADQVGAHYAALAFVREQLGPAVDAGSAVAAASQKMQQVDVQRRTIGKAAPANDNQFSYTAPSNLVLFVFITSLASGGGLVERRRLGVTRRMLSAPITPSTILVGTGVNRYLIALFQAALVIAIGTTFFSVTWGQPLGVTVLVAVYAMVGASAGLLVGSIARTPEQTSAVGIPVAIGMGMLGGCMWPLDVVPAPLRTIGHLTPQAWAMDGFVGLIYNGEGLGGIAGSVLVLGLYAAVLGTLAVVALRRSLTR